jgi:hypothetical protein
MGALDHDRGSTPMRRILQVGAANTRVTCQHACLLALAGMDALTVWGVVSVGSMLVFYLLEPRSPRYVLLFAAACLASSSYGFLQGAWPFGVIEVVWAVVAWLRWRERVRG